MNWVLLFTPLVLGSISGLTAGNFDNAPKVPGFRPPDWVFAPVWTILYLLMGLAAAQSKSVPPIFWVQLALNILWSPVFVRYRNPKLALAIIIALWGTIFMTIKQLGSQGKLLYPYLAWVSFATYLNAKVVFPSLSTALEGT